MQAFSVRQTAAVLVSPLVLAVASSCSRPQSHLIADIPRTTGTQLWEAERFGATNAAKALSFRLYWNGPSREDDVQRQIDIIASALARKPVGLILAPDHSLALISSVQRALSDDVAVVIIDSPVLLEPSPNLYFVLNDEEAAGKLAADRIGALVAGKGTIAVLGIDPNIAGVMDRLASFEHHIAHDWPGISITEERLGYFKPAQAQQVAEDVMSSQPHLSAVFALTAVATRGALLALRQHSERGIRLVGCEQDLAIPIESPELDSLVIENTPAMGEQAVRLINDHLHGMVSPHLIRLKPDLLTRANSQQPAIARMLVMGPPL